MSAVIVRSNLPDFRRQLQRVSIDLQRNAVKAATGAAAAVVRGYVKKAAGQRLSPKATQPLTGYLAGGVYAVRNRRESTRGAEVRTVGIRSRTGKGKRKPPGIIARFLEYGWIPRQAGYRGGGRRRRALANRRDAARKVQYPFFDKAFAAGQSRAIDVFSARLTREIAKLNAIR